MAQATQFTHPAAGDDPVVPCGPACPLADLRRGQEGVVTELLVEGSDRALLDSMGLRTTARVRVCRTGHTCVVVASGPDLGACRLGLERRLAQRVMVAVAAG